MAMNAQVNGEIVSSLRHALGEGEFGLAYVPKLIKEAIENHAWEEFYDEVERDVLHHSSFESFVTTEPPEGLGTDVRMIQNMCRDHTEILDQIDEATQRKDGNPHSLTVDNVNTSRPDGNSAARALRKLRSDAPEIHAKVIAGELSPNAGMVEAGFRKKTATVSVDPKSFATAILKRFTAEEIREIIELLEVGAL